MDAGSWDCTECDAEKGCKQSPKPNEVLEIFLDGASKFSAFTNAVRENETIVLSAMKRIFVARVAISSATKARATAAALLLGGKTLKKFVLEHIVPEMNVAEMLGMIRLLDAPRLRRQLQKRKEKLLQAEFPKMHRIRDLNSKIKDISILLEDEVVEVSPQKKDAKMEREAGEETEENVENVEKVEKEETADTIATTPQYSGSLSGSIAKQIKRWARKIPESTLEFFMLNFSTGALPTQPWQDVADKVHFGPSDFALPYFLYVTHGAAAPEDTLVHKISTFSGDVEHLSNLFKEFPQLANYYSYIRKRFTGRLPIQVVKQIFANAPLDDIFWFYDEIMSRSVKKAPKNKRHSKEIEKIVNNRLKDGEELDLRDATRANYGKLVQSLLNLRRQNVSFLPALLETCEKEMTRLKDKYGESDARIAVLGDCSGSMQVAVETATIVGSMLSSVLRAELVFFNDILRMPDRQPTSVADVLHITESIRAERRTSPAAALLKYYNDRQVMDLFVLVTDEYENGPVLVEPAKWTCGPDRQRNERSSKSVLFAELWKMYLRDINPDARLFFVSFLDKPISENGQMRKALNALNIESREFRMSTRMPDLTKLPQILALLSLGIVGSEENWVEQSETEDANADEVESEEVKSSESKDEEVVVSGVSAEGVIAVPATEGSKVETVAQGRESQSETKATKGNLVNDKENAEERKNVPAAATLQAKDGDKKTETVGKEPEGKEGDWEFIS